MALLFVWLCYFFFREGVQVNKVILKNVRPFVQGSFQPLTTMNLVDGRWVGESIEGAIEIEGNGALALPALFALGLDFQEPLRDDFYTFQNGYTAMRRGGFYGGLYESSANPIDDVQKLSAIQQVFSKSGLHLSILGAFSKHHMCEQLSEMLELASCGVCGFGDGNHLNATTRFLRLAMEYGAMSSKRFFFLPLDLSLRCAGCVHEGDVADVLGMKGIPRIAETIVVHTILETALFLNVPIHLKQITCSESLNLIEQARARGLDVTCDVGLYHLLFDEQVLFDLDSHFNLIPPLRSPQDKQALWDGLKRGVVDAISCNHTPVLRQEKEVNFEDAVAGAISLEVALPAIWSTLVDHVGERRALDLLSFNPAKIACAGLQKMEKRSNIDLVLLDPREPSVVSPKILSGAVQNTPLLNKQIPSAIKGSYIQGLWTQV